MTVRAHAQPDKFNHSCYGFLEHLRNRLKVKDGPQEIGIFDGAKAEEGDVA